MEEWCEALPADTMVKPGYTYAYNAPEVFQLPSVIKNLNEAGSGDRLKCHMMDADYNSWNDVQSDYDLDDPPNYQAGERYADYSVDDERVAILDQPVSTLMSRCSNPANAHYTAACCSSPSNIITNGRAGPPGRQFHPCHVRHPIRRVF